MIILLGAQPFDNFCAAQSGHAQISSPSLGGVGKNHCSASANRSHRCELEQKAGTLADRLEATCSPFPWP
ncbi:uncharacterized protein BKA78DRAFT_313461 [Phyllosticta capitalensis]|uniref:uncharacterized protein n=1 Tax=Phyllosticta capitalensis TaxID=121624 RepID=UPI003131AABE